MCPHQGVRASIIMLAGWRRAATHWDPLLRTAYRRMSSVGDRAKALVYDAPGEPEDVLKLSELELKACGVDEIELQFLQAPINPSDVNTVQGKYPLQPKLPGGVPGHEGVGKVTSAGSKVTSCKVGDWVVPVEPAQGTWRKKGVFKAEHFHPVPQDIPLEAAATISINPPSALAMLENYVDLQEGDVVVQNGANSAVGQAVIQLAKAKGVKTINIIRDRPDWDDTVAFLKGLGADVVTTEAKAKEDAGALGLPAPVLGLNCVGGSSALAVAKLLREGGTMVTYGGMSMQPVSIPTSLLIFKDIRFVGFWLSGRLAKEQGKGPLLDKLTGFIREGKLKPPKVQTFALEDYKAAFEASKKAHKDHKVVFKP